jgi:hypothetical protein
LHQWYGVVCDAQGHIVSLDLSQNGLVGPIPAAFQDLTWLNSIKLYANKLTGCIPTFFAGNTNLQTLYLQNNKLIGSIPHSVATVSETKDGSVLCGCKVLLFLVVVVKEQKQQGSESSIYLFILPLCAVALFDQYLY